MVKSQINFILWMNGKQLYAINKIKNSLCHVKFWFYHLPYIGSYLPHVYRNLVTVILFFHVKRYMFIMFMSFPTVFLFPSFRNLKKWFQWFRATWLWLQTKKCFIFVFFLCLAWDQRAIAKFKRNLLFFFFAMWWNWMSGNFPLSFCFLIDKIII